MGWSQVNVRIEHVLVDLNTQRDFLDTAGALRVHNHAPVVAALRRLMAWARHAHVPIVSSVEAYHIGYAFNGVPRHCENGTVGQNKLPFTLMPGRVSIEADNGFDLPYEVLSRYSQVIFRKQGPDFFTNPKADRLLTELAADEFIVFGVAAERAVKAVALGLLARHKSVCVVTDVCGHFSEADADLSFRQLAAKGVRLATTDEILGSAPAERPRHHSPDRTSVRHHPTESRRVTQRTTRRRAVR